MKTFGPYEILGELGRGGMGAVFRARHVPTGALRALKLLDGAPDDAEGVERFRREAQALARLEGKGVVPVHDAGTEGRFFYFAMDLMPGGSLRDRLKRSTRLEWREAARIVARLARTLARCHAVQLVHRDVKPDNVLFDEAGEPRLGDFGCVRDLGRSALTQSGASPGTPAYMAPELLNGQRAGPPADVYALGAILHELLTGERPYSGPAVTLYDLALAGKRARPSEVVNTPVVLDRVIDRALEPAPGKRALASELAEALESIETSGVEPPAPPPPRGRSLLLPLGLAVAGAVGLLVWALAGARRPDDAPAASPSAGPSPARPTPTASPAAHASPASPSPAAAPDPRLVEHLRDVEAFGTAASLGDPRALAKAPDVVRVGTALQALAKSPPLYHQALGALGEAAWRLACRVWMSGNLGAKMNGYGPSTAAIEHVARDHEDKDGVLRAGLHVLRIKIPWRPEPTPFDQEAWAADVAALASSSGRDPIFLETARLLEAESNVHGTATPSAEYAPRLDMARELCRRALEDPEIAARSSEDFAHRLAREIYVKLSQIEEAFTYVHVEPDRLEADYDACLKARWKARELDHPWSDEWLRDTHDLLKVHFVAAAVARRASRPERAARHLDEVVQIASDLGPESIDAALVRGGLAHARGAPEEREAARQRLAKIAASPDDKGKNLYHVLVLLAQLDLDADDRAAAEAHLRDAAHTSELRGIVGIFGLSSDLVTLEYKTRYGAGPELGPR